MSDTTLKRIIALVIALLLIHQIGTLISGLFGMVWGMLSVVVVAGVSFFSMRLAKAGGKSSAWFLLPTLLFTVVPLIISTWKTFAENTDWLERTLALAPFVFGFAAPVLLLLVVYYELRARTGTH
jgi:hypothetical protein